MGRTRSPKQKVLIHGDFWHDLAEREGLPDDFKKPNKIRPF
jgi:hypothetical protein